jgi:uncharacterized membrane protein YeaQ/YmgE (transglycosylase-associated protein family)
MDAATFADFGIIAIIGGLAGLLGGFLGSADSLVGTLLMGAIGGIAASAIVRIANGPSFYSIGDDFSLVWAAVGGFVLGFAVSRSN